MTNKELFKMLYSLKKYCKTSKCENCKLSKYCDFIPVIMFDKYLEDFSNAIAEAVNEIEGRSKRK